MNDREAAAWTRGHAVGERELKAAEKRWQAERAELKAEVERLRAELARLTTLRPASEWVGKMPALLFDQHKKFAGSRDCGPYGFGKIPQNWYWTPLPALKEPK